MCIRSIVFLLLVLNLSSADDGGHRSIKYKVKLYYHLFSKNCNNGAKCMIVKNCKGIYNSLKQLDRRSSIRLLQSLHCGFVGKKAKICCPWEFQRFEEKIEEKGIDLLPNKTVCGTGITDKIVGGTKVALDEHPWMVLLKYDRLQGSSFLCGGVLISSRYVMTAAHGLKSISSQWKLSQVRLGEWNLADTFDCVGGDCSPDPLDVDIEETIVHERYNNASKWNDIALLRLARDIHFTDYVKPICLPLDLSLRRNTFENYDMDVAGWGKTETRIKSDVKSKVTVTVRSQSDSQKVYNSAKLIISENQICAGGLKGQDSCKGDSGGPLMGRVDVSQNWIALGVVSYGPIICGTPGWPGVYTRVTSYVDWILSKTRP